MSRSGLPESGAPCREAWSVSGVMVGRRVTRHPRGIEAGYRAPLRTACAAGMLYGAPNPPYEVFLYSGGLHATTGCVRNATVVWLSGVKAARCRPTGDQP